MEISGYVFVCLFVSQNSSRKALIQVFFLVETLSCETVVSQTSGSSTVQNLTLLRTS